MSRRLKKIVKLSALYGFLAFGAFATIPAGAQTAPVQPSLAQRQTMAEHHKKMADMHSKMSACLLSDASVTQCRQEMRDGFRALGGDRCPFFGDRGMRGPGRGMMGNQECFDWMMAPGSENNK